ATLRRCAVCWGSPPPFPTATRRPWPADLQEQKMSTRARKQIILAAYVGGVNEHTAWEHPDAGSQIAFDTFRQVAQTAERGRFDYFFLAEGLALRERAGRVFEHDIAGRPDTLPVLAALAAVTEHI